LDISNQKITALDISDCSQLRELNCSNNHLTNLDISNNQQIEQINFTNNQLTNLDLTELTKIEKIFGSDNQLTNLEFLKDLNPIEIRTLRLDNNDFPAQDLSCFSHLTGLNRLFISNNPFYGSLKPLRHLTELREISITDTNVDSGLEYLPESFFQVNATAASLGLTGGYFKKKLFCTGKLAEQLKDYQVENDSLKNYDWQT
jgi:Leucine-rich repeat (LRR) protein